MSELSDQTGWNRWGHITTAVAHSGLSLQALIPDAWLVGVYLHDSNDSIVLSVGSSVFFARSGQVFVPFSRPISVTMVVSGIATAVTSTYTRTAGHLQLLYVNKPT